jgi:Icc-related predicted phosphoesterase
MTLSQPADTAVIDFPARDVRPVRIAAIGDLHIRTELPESLITGLETISRAVDLVIIAGDITENGRLPEVALASDYFRQIETPVISVLGNHDRRCIKRAAFRQHLDRAGIILLDGNANVFRLGDGRVIGVAGIGGYGGGFWPEETPTLPTARISKAVGIRARREAERLEHALGVIGGDAIDIRIVVMHYAPTVSTLGSEPLLKYWMLGNSLLGATVDQHDIDLVIHGHAHLGNQVGQTPGGTPVRNVAAHVTGGPVIYDVGPNQQVSAVPVTDVLGDLGRTA